MNMNWAAWSILLAAAAAAGPVFAAGTNSAEFLRFGAGAPSSMAEASGASDQGATAVYWNPAGLAAITDREVYLSHMALPLGVNYDFAGAGLPVKEGIFRGVVGAGLQILTQPSQAKLDNTGADVGRLGTSDQALTLSWARDAGFARAGGSVKFIRQSLDTASGSTFALDLGLQRDMGKRGSLGAAVSNVGPPLAVATAYFPLPMTLRLGGAYTLIKGLLGAADVSFSKDRGARAHLGARYHLTGPLSLSLGYAVGGAQPDGPNGLAAGVGLDGKRFRADFAFRPYGEFGSALQIGMGYRFGDASRAAARSDKQAPQYTAP